MKTLLLILAIGAVVLFVPVGIAASEGLQAEAISAGEGGVEIKIAHLSDLQYPRCGVEPERILAEIRAFSPDMIVLTGDIFESSATEADVRALGGFLEELGGCGHAYAVLGNHETILKDLRLYKSMLRSFGIVLLENEAVETEVNGVKIGVAGVSDKYAYGRQNIPALDALTPGIPILLLAHRPEKWESYLAATGDRIPFATFAGHAHGGQFRIFGKGLYTPGTGYFPKYCDGLYRDKATGNVLIVSRGLGDSTFPFRLYNKYHLPLITIRFS